MDRTAWLCSLAVLTGLFLAPARGERPSLNKDILVLQEAMQDAIEQAEPSVACILVSRSDKYKEFGAAPSEDRPGELGEFHFNYKGYLPENPRRTLAERLDLANAKNVPESFGSGVVIDEKDRLVLTNYHVVKGATKLYVRLPGSEGSYANIYAADPRSDLAVLQLISKIPVKAIRVGDATRVKKGMFVLTIANPYAAGFKDGSPSASWGIISNIRQRAPRKKLPFGEKVGITENNLTLHHYGTLLQTDARLNLGCSGGALIDLHGELIGLTTSLAAISGSETPGGFAVPLDDTMRRIIDRLRRGEEVEYGFLGVSFNNTGPNSPVQINKVFPGSPADKAGLRNGDTIREVNGTTIKTLEDIYLPLAKLPPKARVNIKVSRLTDRWKRVSEDLVFKPVLAKFAVQGKIIAHNRREFRGLRVDYTSLLVQSPQLFLDEIPAGVFACEVKPDSPAGKTKLAVGDIITEVNGRSVADPDQFYQAVQGLTGPVELTVTTAGGKTIKVAIE